MELILWRHAEADDTVPDLKRELTDKGRKQASRLAVWLSPRLSQDIRILGSPATRTLQPAQALGRGFPRGPARAPGASADDVLAAAGWPEAAYPVLVVGHQPTLGQVAMRLLTGQAGDLSVKKGSIWWLQSRERAGQVQVVLRAVATPYWLYSPRDYTTHQDPTAKPDPADEVRPVTGWLSSLRDLIAEASPLRSFMFVLLVLLPLAALSAAYVWLNPADYRVLYPKLSDRAGGEVIAALDQLNISYHLSAADGSIEGPADQLHVARYRLAARGLPRSDADAQDEIDRAPRFGASSLEEQQRYQHALESDLARSIQSLETVELARVHLALPKVSPFLRDAPPATAAVLVRLRPNARLSAEQVTTIQTLVAASVPRMKRSEVQVFDPRGVLLGDTVPEVVQSRQRAVEQDLAQRALAVLTPWLGKDRVSVQVTATLEDSDVEQTVERVRNVVVGGRTHPLEKTVRTTHTPEGRIRRVNAIVILGFEASAAELGRAGQLARQALGLVPSRGDTVNVYALPATHATQPPAAVAQPQAQPPRSLAPMPPASQPPATSGIVDFQPWMLAAVGGGLLLLLGVAVWRRPRPVPAVEPPAVDLDAELEATRGQVLANPRVTADVIKLWMRA